MKHHYNCKFCGVTGTVESGDTTNIKIHIDKWLPMIACDRCATFHESRLKMTDRIVRVCVALKQARQTRHRELTEIENRTRGKLVELTKRFAGLACDYWRKQNIWDCEFSNCLMDKPDNAYSILSFYLKGVSR